MNNINFAEHILNNPNYYGYSFKEWAKKVLLENGYKLNKEWL